MSLVEVANLSPSFGRLHAVDRQEDRAGAEVVAQERQQGEAAGQQAENEHATSGGRPHRLGNRPATEAYVARVTQRPAFEKAHADQLAHFAAGDKARGN